MSRRRRKDSAIERRARRREHIGRDAEWHRSIHTRTLKTPPPEPTLDVCSGCGMAASTWPTRRAFRAHQEGCA